jgi:hypothetical protein
MKVWILFKFGFRIKSQLLDLFSRTRATNLYQDGTELELISRILGHSSTETTRIYAVPSLEMMRKAMETGNMSTDEKPLWPDDEAEIARICGLR